MTHQRVETYSVYGGIDETSLANPKSATLRTSFVTSKFSSRGKIVLILVSSTYKEIFQTIYTFESTRLITVLTWF